MQALVAAYMDCRATKRNSAAALAFEQHAERNLLALLDELQAGAYRPGRSICFVVTRPKPREVWAAAFRDRVVHHLLYRHIAPRFHAGFAAGSSACIPGRGTLYAGQRLLHSVRSITRNGTQRASYLQCDLANFFVSLDRRVLMAQLARKVHEPAWLELTHTVLMHDPRGDVEVRGERSLLRLVPPHKSLFNAPPDTGLPIGNLSSQFAANVHLDALDQHIVHRLRPTHYVRYVDDFVLLHRDPAMLSAALRDITAWLPATLHARLNPAKTIQQPVARGIDFVGHVVRPHSHTLRRKTLRSAIARLEHLPADETFATGNSYLALARQVTHGHTDQARIARALLKRGHCVDADLSKAYRRGSA